MPSDASNADAPARTRAQPKPSARSQSALDWLNFFIADVQTAYGPFIAVWLTAQGWHQGAIGTVITVNNVVALATQIPAGWLVDAVRGKRRIVAACLVCIAGGALLIALFPTYLPVLAGEALHGLTGGVGRTVLAAIALGLVGHRAFHTRVGRNQRYDSLGNAATAAGMGMLGKFVSPRAPFFAAVSLCIPAAIALAFIRGREISYARARQATDEEEKRASPWRDLVRNRTLLTFSASLFLFQFADASVLPLASERLAAEHANVSELVTSALVVVQELVSGLIAAWLAARAEDKGRKAMLILAFAALLLRTGLFALPVGPWVLTAFQIPAGLDAAVLGILSPLVVADCTKGSGRYNVMLGAVGLVGVLGAAISTTAMGYMAQLAGFTPAFVALAAVGAAGLFAIWRFLPETVQSAREAD